MPEQISQPVLEETDLERLIADVPLLAQRPFAGWRVARLPGLTNRSWRLSDDTLDIVLRVPGHSAGRYLNRTQEFHNVGVAARIGIAPPLLHADPESGIMVQEYLPGAAQLQQSDFADPATAFEIGALLARLHAAPEPFKGTMAPFPVIDLYLSLAADDRLRDLRKRADPIRRVLEMHPEPSVPSHIDPNPSNFLRIADGSLRLIDWEFSAMCEPAWDLAAVMMEADLSAARAEAVLKGYGWTDSPARRSRLWLMRAALHLVAGSWTHAEIAGGNTAPSLPALLEHYLTSLERMMDGPEWSSHLRAVRD
ncbi:MAG TPA: phosphotransferase [Dongiaceae bacterium]|jgi:thiamine kinase-like enzyme